MAGPILMFLGILAGLTACVTYQPPGDGLYLLLR